jgi:transposase
MAFTYILGVDMSKDWFHACLMDKQLKIIVEKQVSNEADPIMEFISELLEQQGIEGINSIFLCMEHTGLYIQNLVRTWMMKGGQLAVIPANKISEGLTGLQGWVGKTDFVDARRIAEYGIRFSDKLKPFKLKGHTMELLLRLQRQHTRFLTVLNILEVPVAESENFDSDSIVTQIQQNQENTVDALKRDLQSIDTLMAETIKKDPYLNRIFKLMNSVPGVGPVTSTEIIIATEGFSKFSPCQAKMFAKYSGVVPIEHSSVKSLRKRPRITKRANGKIKSLLTMGAMSLTKTKGELGTYYKNKIMEGKHHLSVINAMRNKLILRIFAVVRNDSMYIPNFEYVA